MQHFINPGFIDRVCGEVFASARRSHYAMSVLAVAIGVAAGPAVAATWLGLALLVAEGKRSFDTGAPGSSRISTLAMAVTLAAAPALIWFSPMTSASVLAVAALAALAIHTIAGDGGKGELAWTLSPLGVVALTMLINGVGEGQALIAVATAACCGFAVAAFHYAARSAETAREQDAEWVRQLNMTFGGARSTAWEIDYRAQTLVGGDRLAALLGRAVCYEDVVGRACFATAADRRLVESAFAPRIGAMRRISIEHEFIRPDGTTGSVRHHGFVRVAPDGAPTRLTCVSEPGGDYEAGADATLMRAQRVLEEQAHSLLVISNELGAAERADPPEAECGDALHRHVASIERRSALLADAIDDLVKAHHEAHEASLAKSQFLASMSHELRTPLNAIIGYAEMLQEDASDNGDAAAIQDLARILTAARHLLVLIGEIVDLSKIEAGRVDVAPVRFMLDELIQEVMGTMRPLAEQNRNVLRLDLRTPDLELNTDATKVRQCVLNFLSNACKFTTDGEIVIEVERRELHGVPQVYVSVADTGIGMSDEQMSRLFQPFVQADPSITRQYGGTGLGLTITRRLAQLLGGDVAVQSELGGGATFTLHLPADFGDAAAALGARAQIDPLQGAESAPMVLVIEDEPDARELAARALTRAGFSVQGVGGGEIGLALARSKTPALILLDIFLPDRSGWRVLQTLKHDPRTRDIPVVVLSVNEDRAHALELGAAEHIIKPADRDVLAATVMRLARGRPNLASLAPARPQRAAG